MRRISEILQILYDLILTDPIVSGLVVFLISSLIAGVVQGTMKLIQRRFRSSYSYLIGSYDAYYFLRDGETTIEMAVTIYSRQFRKLEIKIQEKTPAAYVYHGEIEVVEDLLFAYMRGTRQQDRAFLVCKLPFNRGDAIAGLIGVLIGVTQGKEAAATKVILSRVPLTKDQVKYEFGEKPWAVIAPEFPSFVRAKG